MKPAIGSVLVAKVSKIASPRVKPGQPPGLTNSSNVPGDVANVLVSCWKPPIAMRAMVAPSDVGVAVGLGLAAGMGHRALLGVADGLGVAPQGARLEVVLARLPGLLARGQLGVAELDVERARHGVDRD